MENSEKNFKYNPYGMAPSIEEYYADLDDALDCGEDIVDLL